MVTISEDTTRDDLAETLSHLNADAKAFSRQGVGAQRDPRYEDLHRNIDLILCEYERAVDDGRP